MVSSDEYLLMLKKLLPPGVAFPRGDATSFVALLLECWAIELSRADARIDALIRENDPRISVECFSDWLEEWGLPDVCTGLLANMTDTTLRQLLLFKVTTVGGQNRQFFADLAARFGYRIQIDEYRHHTVDSQVMDGLWSSDVEHYWKCNILTGAENATAQLHNTLGVVSEPLAWWGDQLIECLIEKYKPAQSEVLFGYYGID